MKKTATAEEIRKAFRKAARRYHPDVNPGDKRAEEKFKEISEANDVLSDEKKRKVYDQVGFYSDQIDPATGRGLCAAAARAARPPVDFGGFDFSGFQGGPGSTGQQAGAGSASWGSFKDIFSGIFSGRAAAAAAARPAAGNRSGVSGHCGLLDGDSRRPGAHCRCIARRSARPATARRQTGGPMQCPECNGTGQVTQMGGRMKFNIPCPRCNGTGRISNVCATCRGEGVVSRDGDGGVPHQAGHPRRTAHPPAGQGKCRGERRPGRGSVCDRAHRDAPGLHPRRRRYSDHGSGHRARGIAGRQGGCADH